MAIRVSGNTVIDDSRNWSGSLIPLSKVNLTFEKTGGESITLKTIGDDFLYSQNTVAGTFNGVSISPVSIKVIDQTKAVIAYKDYDVSTNAYFGKVRLVTISGTNITYGNPITFQASNVEYISMDFISSTQGLIGYSNGGNSNYCTICPVQLIDNTLTIGTPVVVDSVTSRYVVVEKIDSTRWLVSNRNDNSGFVYPRSRIVSFNSFNNVTVNTLYTWDTWRAERVMNFAVVNPTRFVQVSISSGVTHDIALLAMHSNNQITKITSLTIETFGAGFYEYDLKGLSSNTFLYAFNSGTTAARVSSYSIANDTITRLDTITLTSGYPTNVKISPINSNKAILSLGDFGLASIISITSTPSANLSIDRTIAPSLIYDFGYIETINENNFLYSRVDPTLNATNAAGIGVSRILLPYNNYQLANTNGQAQRVSTDGNTYSVIFPSGSTLNEGYNIYSIVNKGPILNLYSSSNTLHGTLGMNDVATCSLIDANTNSWSVSVANTPMPLVYGTQSTITSQTNLNGSSIAALSSNTIIATYDSSQNGNCCIIVSSGTNLFPNNQFVFNSGSTASMSVTALTSNTAIVAYRDVANANVGSACILSVSGNTITAQTEMTFSSGNTSSISIASLSSNTAIVVYRDEFNANSGTSLIMSVSDNTITAQTNTVFNSGNTSNISVLKIDSNKALAVYRDEANSNVGTACILNVLANNAITAQTEVVFNSGNTSSISASLLNSNSAIVAYRDEANSNFGSACVLSISGNTIIVRAETVFNSGNTSSIAVNGLNSNAAIVTYRDESNSNVGTMHLLSIYQNAITPITRSVFNSSNTTLVTTCPLDTNTIAVSYKNSSGFIVANVLADPV